MPRVIILPLDSSGTRHLAGDQQTAHSPPTTNASRAPIQSPADEGLDAEVAGAARTPSIAYYDSRLRDLIVTQNYPVLFVGESRNRALPLAIGVLRGSLQGIWATCYHPGADNTHCHWHDGIVMDRDKAIRDTHLRIMWNERDRNMLQSKSQYVMMAHGIGLIHEH